MKLTPSEQAAIDDIVRDLPADEAERMRKRLATPGVKVWGNDPEMHQRIEAFYDAVSARQRASKEAQGFILAPRSAKNSWSPRPEEQLLINSVLNRIPEENRAGIREALLRNDTRIDEILNDPEATKIIKKIYELRDNEIRKMRADSHRPFGKS